MDSLSPEQRSARMALIRSSNTKPELLVRRLLHSLGYRYTLNDRTLPGTPDIVFRSRHKAIFVHGCFWHSHSDCKISHIPKTDTVRWKAKLDGTVARDERNRRELLRLGWSVLTVWECELSSLPETKSNLLNFVGKPRM